MLRNITTFPSSNFFVFTKENGTAINKQEKNLK